MYIVELWYKQDRADQWFWLEKKVFSQLDPGEEISNFLARVLRISSRRILLELNFLENVTDWQKFQDGTVSGDCNQHHVGWIAAGFSKEDDLEHDERNKKKWSDGLYLDSLPRTFSLMIKAYSVEEHKI